ncbi:hypothetical protein A2J03_23440 [Rhodococcus sp. EPR-157]|nr:hypothetical protein A2J03_23440 [Rhodococcus sp. EPR-157]
MSKGPVIAVGTVVVMVLAVLGWFQLRERIADQGVEAADTCVEGTAVIPVTVDPDVSSQITRSAADFTATAPVVRDHCISLEVTTHESTQVANALAADVASWDDSMLGPLPALWIPRSSDALVDLPVGTVDGTPRSVASTPVVLAVPGVVAEALDAADIGWADLPRLQSAPDGMDTLGLPGWGGLRLRLPVGPDSESSAAALSAVAATTYDSSTPVPASELVRRSSTATALSALATTDRGTPSTTTESTDSALGMLSRDSTPTSDVHAVPVTEQQLDASAQSGLTAYAPSGTTPIADHPAAILAREWTDETSRRAAAQFVDFLRQPENAQMFVDSGFDVGEPPSGSPAVGIAAQSALVDAVLDPATTRRVTTLLDISGSMDTTEGSNTRLDNTVAALDQQFGSAIDSSELGLWVFSKDLDGTRAFRTLVPTGPIDEPIDSSTRREQLIAAAGAVRPATATSTYEAVIASFLDAQETYSPGKPNSVLLVTDGPNDDTTITSSRFLSTLSEMVDPTRPITIDVVSIGTNSDGSTLQSMSDITGGSFTTVGSSDGAELPDLLRKLLH